MTEEAVTGAEAAPGVGQELAQAREASGYSIADIAQQLKFAPRQIEALEAGRFEDLPAGTFARGMVRSYARLLKLDPEPLVGRMARRVAVPDNAEVVARVQRPIPIHDSARRTNLVYAALSVVFLVVIAGVAVEWQRDRSNGSRMTFVDAAQKAPAPAPSAPVAPEPTRTEVASTVTPPLASVAVPSATEARPAATEVPPAPAPGKRRISLHFDRESWVQIRNRDGRILTSELNAAGTERVVDGLPPFELVIGNAQYVRLSYDDKPVDLSPHVKVEVARFTLN